jgi:hypothetical protein
MKTNHIIKIGLLASLTVSTGCGDSFLDVTSHTQDFVETYYTDSLHISQSLIAAYSPLQWNDWNGNQYNPQNAMSDIMGDDMLVGGQSVTDNQFWHLMANYEAQPNNCMTGMWSNMYSGVKRSNDLLKYANEHQQNLPAASYKLWTAEARTLRAYYYNMLWKFWGNIPFYFENLSAPFRAPQLSADEVYNKVIADLEDVISMKVLPIRWDDANLGRVTQPTAYMLYAEMVMYQKDQSRYPKALEYMQEIINSGKFNLNPNYADLFTAAGEWGDESIFEVNYSDLKTNRGWSTGDAIIAGGTVLPRLASVPGGIPELGIDDGWGFCPIRESAYKMFDTRDARRNASILDVRSYNNANPNFKARYQNTGFWCGKFAAYSKNVERATGDKQLNYNNNLRVYRYAETLLNAAELLLRTNGSSATALTYVNKLRSRAGIANLSAVTLDDIINERHLEFVGEGKRYWDLVRTDKAATVLGSQQEYRTNAWTPDRKYQPIPYTELSKDTELKQNPGY